MAEKLRLLGTKVEYFFECLKTLNHELILEGE